MGNLTIEEYNKKFYIYDLLESGNCICLGVYDTKKSAEKYLEKLIDIEMKQAA